MQGWTTLHDVTFLYLFLAENVDRDLSRSERQVIVQRLSRFAPAEGADYMKRVLREARDALNDASPDETAGRIIQSLRGAPLSDAQRREIWRDLQGIAAADGGIGFDERGFLADLARVWDLDAASA